MLVFKRLKKMKNVHQVHVHVSKYDRKSSKSCQEDAMPHWISLRCSSKDCKQHSPPTLTTSQFCFVWTGENQCLDVKSSEIDWLALIFHSLRLCERKIWTCGLAYMLFGGRKTRKERKNWLKVRLFGFPDMLVTDSTPMAATQCVTRFKWTNQSWGWSQILDLA